MHESSTGEDFLPGICSFNFWLFASCHVCSLQVHIESFYSNQVVHGEQSVSVNSLKYWIIAASYFLDESVNHYLFERFRNGEEIIIYLFIIISHRQGDVFRLLILSIPQLKSRIPRITTFLLFFSQHDQQCYMLGCHMSLWLQWSIYTARIRDSHARGTQW